MNKKLAALFLSFVCLSLLAPAAQADAGKEIAQAYGVASFGRVERLDYTFNANVGGKTISRSWSWWPKEQKVTFKSGSDEAQSFELDDTASSEAEDKVRSWFVNDQYWLLFPFHLVWDSAVTVEELPEPAVPPGAKDAARHVIVRYTGDAGYTPGDIYELFVGERGSITHWLYRRGGGEVTRSATWEGNRSFGALTLALDHRDPDSDFRVWFSDVNVTWSK